jgi:GAF domain-containing protein
MTGSRALTPRAARADRLANRLAGGFAATLDAIVERVRDQADADGAHLGLLADRQITASQCVRAGDGSEPGVSELVERGQATPYEDTICANVLRLDDDLLIPDTADDERVSSLPAVQSGAVGSYAGVPVRLDDAIVGVLCLWNTAPHPWSDAELALLRAGGEQVAAELAVLEAATD